MSLSKPPNPVFIADVAVPATASVGMLDTNENATRVNQLHGIASNNALGAGIPNQVSSVQASVANAQTGATCTVSVLYRVDPTDKNFAGVNIWVKGYQGNNQLVRVASGASSPTKFVLNNTGEIVSFTVQAYGNGGSAPLTGSPTCSGTLPQSTGGGFGSSTIVTPPVVTSIQKVTVTLTAAQLKTLTTVPVELIPAPGAGNFIAVLFTVANYIYAGTAFGAAGEVELRYGTLAGAWAQAIMPASGFLSKASSQVLTTTVYGPSTTVTAAGIFPVASVVNANLNAFNTAAAINTGNGSLVLTIYYQIVSVS